MRIQEFFEKNYVESDKNVLFLYLSDFYIDPRALKNFKVKNTIIVNFSWDDRLHYESSHSGQSVGVRGIAKVSDINLTMAVAPLLDICLTAHRYFIGMDRISTINLLAKYPVWNLKRLCFLAVVTAIELS
jgi:hypothetical protein